MKTVRTFYCEVCKMYLPMIEYAYHLAGKHDGQVALTIGCRSVRAVVITSPIIGSRITDVMR